MAESRPELPVHGSRKWFDLQTTRGWAEAVGAFVTIIGSAVGVYLQLFPNKGSDTSSPPFFASAMAGG